MTDIESNLNLYELMLMGKQRKWTLVWQKENQEDVTT
jgi:hypothetical protein